MNQLYSGNLAALNPELMLLTDILKLNSLHYGYWDESEELNIENLRIAQERYTHTLIDLIPERVKSILDVGCGIGDVAQVLSENGYQVTAISPDENHRMFFKVPSKNQIEFHNVKFEDLILDDRFDCIMMNESHNYFDAEVGFNQCKKLISPGGYVLVSGMFRQVNTQIYELCNLEKEFIEKANRRGFILVKSIDITEKVLPTMELTYHLYQSIKNLVVSTINEHLYPSTHRKVKILRFLFKKEFRRFSQLQNYYQNRIDPQNFKEMVKYQRFVFRESD